MRDLYFRPTRTLSEYTRLAERDGAIPDLIRPTVTFSVWCHTG